MKKLMLVLFALLALVCVNTKAAPSLRADISAVINSDDVPGAQPGEWMQIGPVGTNGTFAWGSFESYEASADLPQAGSDLDRFGWSMLGTVDTIDTANKIITYSGTWTINYLNSDNTSYFELESGTFTMQADYDDNWAVANVSGSLFASSDVRYWPSDTNPNNDGPVDWSPANPGWMLNGQFTSATNTLDATIIAPVPAPGAVLLAGMGVSMAGWLRRRKQL